MTAIHTVDVNYLGTAGAIASYIVIGPAGEPVMVETGPGCAVEGLEAGLKELGLAPRDVRDVLVTHIHFDHAGAAGWMAREGARIHVHEFGAKHLVDPSRLVRSAERIYGDRMSLLWGEIIPVPEDQVCPLYDGEAIEAGGLRFRAIETPGHARHHHAFGLETEDLGRVAFTGDAAATFVGDAPGFISLPTPPPEFELAAWISSIDRLVEERFDRIYPTHFGVVDDVAGHLSRVKQALRDHADFVRRQLDAGHDPDTIVERYTNWFLDHAAATALPESKVGFYVKDTMAGMNVSGMLRYWAKMAERMTS